MAQNSFSCADVLLGYYALTCVVHGSVVWWL